MALEMLLCTSDFLDLGLGGIGAACIHDFESLSHLEEPPSQERRAVIDLPDVSLLLGSSLQSEYKRRLRWCRP